MTLVVLALGIILLFALIVKLKLNSFLALIIASLVVGLAEGIPIQKILDSIINGVGGTLGELTLIVGFGAMLGKLMSECGAAQKIAITLIEKFGEKKVSWSICIISFIIGIALFYEVGFVLLMPLIVSVAVATKMPLLKLGIPMAASLSVAHAFLPPHPGATAVAILLNADIGLTLLYGIIISIPIVIISGPIFYKLKSIQKIHAEVPEGLYKEQLFDEDKLPSFFISLATAILPVCLMLIATVTKLTLPEDSSFNVVMSFIGHPVMALLITVIIAIFTYGLNRGQSMTEVMKTAESSISAIAMILLVIGGGGAFKQVLVDSGIGAYIGDLMANYTLSPLILAWITASIIRLAVGSATVASITAAGIVSPLIATTGASPELMVLAIGAGSTNFGLVNDPGFWMFKEFFNLSVKDCVLSYCSLNTIISVGGLFGVLIFNMFIG